MRRFTTKLHKMTALLCALLLCAAVWMPAVSAAPLAEGSSGDLSWSLKDGVLTIRGDGAIPDYTEHNPAPWYDHRDSILRVQFDGDITAVGAMAFCDCTALVTVQLPNSVTTVGTSAFSGCTALSAVWMPRVITLGDYAFSRCFALQHVTLPDTLTTIGGYAFYRCDTLAYVRVPSSVTAIGSSAFAYCASLLRVDMTANITALPEWCFYGCENLQVLSLPASVTDAGDSAFTRCEALSTVCHGGDDAARQAFSDAVAESLPGFTVSQVGDLNTAPPVATDKDVVADGDTAKEITTQLRQEGDTLVQVEQTVTYPATDGVATGNPTGFDSTVHVTISSSNGWDVLREELRDQINDKSTFETTYGEQDSVRAEVTLQVDTPLTGAWLETLAGCDAVVTILATDGSRFIIDGKAIAGYSFEKSYGLGYTITPCEDLTEIDTNVVGAASCYWLTFRSAFAFPVTVELLLDPYAVHQHVTLYEKVRDAAPNKLQTARLSGAGYASFRLAVINTTTRYLLAMNVASTSTDEVLVPGDREDVEEFLPLSERYTITDIRGWRGLTMKEFTNRMLIIGGVVVALIAVLVVAFILISKRKAKIAAIRAEVMGESTSADVDDNISEQEE